MSADTKFRALRCSGGPARTRGLSLVELMIAMTLGLATIAAIGWIYLGTTQAYRSQDAMARLQEGARYAFEIMSNDLRMTGTTGCSYTKSVNVISGYATRWYTNPLEQPVVSVEKNGTAATVTEFSDALRVLRADVSREYVVQSHNSGTAQFTLKAAHDLTNGALLMATDCDLVSVFQASGATTPNVNHAAAGTPGNSTANLGTGGAAYAFAENSRIYRVSANTYYVATNPAGEPALFRLRPIGASATPTAEELVEGVQDLQISYGVDTDATPDGEANFVDPDGDGDPYLKGDQVNTAAVPGANAQERWTRVVSIRISLLMRTTENNVVPSAQRYTYNGAAVTAGDRRLRKVFTHVVKMRNR